MDSVNTALFLVQSTIMDSMSDPSPNATSAQGLQSDSEGTMTGDDAAWVITNSFIIFTMQTGFGLLESACVSRKNEVNIMVKNIVDVVLGGLTYWAFGYGLSFGKDPGTNPFCGIGHFFMDNYDNSQLGTSFATFIFQLSFATTATTIVSGAMAERCNFTAYCLFSLLNTVVYCIPAGWLWGDHGFLRQMGIVDVAGSGGVHLVGGISAFVSAAMLGPRLGRYDNGTDSPPMGSPINAILGLFVLWWGWLSFNCGSTFGVTHHRWKHAARAGVVTLTSSFGGGLVGMTYRKWDVGLLINSILSSLVGVTAGCSLYHPWEGLIIGMISSLGTCLFTPLVDKLHVDDPVGAVAVHAVGGLWGLLAVGLFVDRDTLRITNGYMGVFKGGGFYLLGIQLLAVVTISAWSAASTFIILFAINIFVPIRMNTEEELIGADAIEHGVYLEESHQRPPTSPLSKTILAVTHISNGRVGPSTPGFDEKVPNDDNGPKRDKQKSKGGKRRGKRRHHLAPVFIANYASVKFAWAK